MKTAFERYIEANNALSKCFEAVPLEQYNGLSASQQESLCKAEKQAVLNFLTTNQVGFANLIKERLQSAGH